MNCNHYQKVVHIILCYDGKFLLSQRLKDDDFKGTYSDPGGKLDKDEFIIDAAQRELEEETGLYLFPQRFELIDCFIYTERELKAFVYQVDLNKNELNKIKDMEPEKHGSWTWFTLEEALSKKLMPSVQFYLEGFKMKKNKKNILEKAYPQLVGANKKEKKELIKDIILKDYSCCERCSLPLRECNCYSNPDDNYYGGY